MKKKQLFLLLTAFVMVVFATVGTSLAYFTTYATAKGGYPIHMGYQTELHESFSAMTKHVSISAAEDSQPVYVRAMAFAGSEFTLTFSGEGWSKGSDGFYYYDSVLPGGETTAELKVKVGVPEGKVYEEGETFNVVVIYESIPALYDETGAPYADWTQKVLTKTENAEGGVKHD